MPEPCRPAIRITVGGRGEKLSPREAPPISAVSSSRDDLDDLLAGVELADDVRPQAALLDLAVNSLTTLKLTSASSSARRISRIARSMSCSLSVPRWRTSERVACSFSERASNIGLSPCRRSRADLRQAAGERTSDRGRSRARRAGVSVPARARPARWGGFGSSRPARAREGLADPTEGLGELRGHDEHLVGVPFRELGQHLQVFVAKQLPRRVAPRGSP